MLNLTEKIEVSISEKENQSTENLHKLLLKNFLSGKSKQTIKAYSDDLNCFRKYLNLADIDEVPRYLLSLGIGQANATVISYKNNLLDQGMQSATINRKLASIRSLVKMGRTFGIINWTLEVRNEKSESYRDTSGPGKNNFQKMLESVLVKDNSKAIRDYAILRLLFDLALRASEVVGLDIEDIDLLNNEILILGKGRKNKIKMSLPTQTKLALEKWVANRSSVTHALFHNLDYSQSCSRLTRVGLYKLIRKIGLKVGIKTRPHGIRHLSITEACKLVQALGMPIEEVLDHSRHKNISTLMIYRDKDRNKQGTIAALVASSSEN